LSLTVGTYAQETSKKPVNQPAPRPVFRMPVALKSAEILPDNSVTFRLLSKEAYLSYRVCSPTIQIKIAMDLRF
jgi:hypothetical protein